MRKLWAMFALAAIVMGGGAIGPAYAANVTAPGAAPLAASGFDLNSGGYKIGAQDTIEVDVFQIPDLSKTGQVDVAGNIRLPLVGAVQAAGRTPAELSDLIETKLQNTYVKDPRVSVTVKESSSRRVTVDGAVVQPGIYPLAGPTTLMQAVALARGPDPRAANIRKVSIFRDVGGQRQATVFNLDAIRSGEAPDPQVYPNDIVVVDTSRGRALLRDLSGALPFFSIFTPF